MANYTIRKGDNLTSIAKRTRTTVEDLMKSNPQIKDKNLIYTGDRMTTPSRNREMPDKTNPSPTWMQEQTKPYSNTHFAPETKETASNSGSYIIKKGDTLTAIAKRKGITVAEIMKLNPQIKDKNLIYAGATLKLPKIEKKADMGVDKPTNTRGRPSR